MTEQQILKAGQNVVGLGGMTVNERLYLSGLMNEFDKAKMRDKDLARKILQALEVDKLSIEQIIGQ